MSIASNKGHNGNEEKAKGGDGGGSGGSGSKPDANARTTETQTHPESGHKDIRRKSKTDDETKSDAEPSKVHVGSLTMASPVTSPQKAVDDVPFNFLEPHPDVLQFLKRLEAASVARDGPVSVCRRVRSFDEHNEPQLDDE
jgi:hypothetical protein